MRDVPAGRSPQGERALPLARSGLFVSDDTLLTDINGSDP